MKKDQTNTQIAAPSIEAQLCVRYDGREFKLEIPQNGGRRVIPIDPNSENNWQIIEDALIELKYFLDGQAERRQILEIRAQQNVTDAISRFAQHRKNWDNTARNHGLEFADNKIGNRKNPDLPVKIDIWELLK